jgi:hypothetical protein
MTNNAQTYFASVAGQWDEIRSGYFTEHMRDSAIAKAALPENAVVADIGTGTGFVAAGLASRAAKVYGFDASAEMLEVARRNLAGFGNVVLQQAPGDSIPLPDSPAWTESSPTCTCTTPPTPPPPSAKWRDCSSPAVCCASPTSIRTTTNGSASKWPTCGWDSSATTCGAGLPKRAWPKSTWTAPKAPATPAGQTESKSR